MITAPSVAPINSTFISHASFRHGKSAPPPKPPATTTFMELLDLLQIPARHPIRIEPAPYQHLKLRRGEKAHRIGHPFDALFVVRCGEMKIISQDEAGEEKVQAFAMKGDLIGSDGIHGRNHVSEAVALSDCELVVVPFRRVRELTQLAPDLDMALYAFLSREIDGQRKLSGMLAGLGAEARVARFLAQLADRYAALGYSQRAFELRMTRQEISSYLGTTVETVSRAFTGLHKMGLIRVDNRRIDILDIDSMAKLRRIPSPKSRE